MPTERRWIHPLRIARYIDEKYGNQGTRLTPTTSDLKTKALFEQAASVEAFNFESSHPIKDPKTVFYAILT